MGDFNETLYGSKHFSATERLEPQMKAFRECIEDCGLNDIGLAGEPFIMGQ
jgi:hypothetical protein